MKEQEIEEDLKRVRFHYRNLFDNRTNLNNDEFNLRCIFQNLDNELTSRLEAQNLKTRHADLISFTQPMEAL